MSDIFQETQAELRKRQKNGRLLRLAFCLIPFFLYISILNYLFYPQNPVPTTDHDFGNVLNGGIIFLFVLSAVVLMACSLVAQLLGMPWISLDREAIQVRTLLRNRTYPWLSLAGFYGDIRKTSFGQYLRLRATISELVDNRAVQKKGYTEFCVLSGSDETIIERLNTCRDAALGLKAGATESPLDPENTISAGDRLRATRKLLLVLSASMTFVMSPEIYRIVRSVTHPEDRAQAEAAAPVLLIMLVINVAIYFYLRRKIKGKSPPET